MLLVLATPSAAAGAGTRVVGGGTGTFSADLDGDGDVDGSQFGIGAMLLPDGSARGHFECLMAGRSDFLGLHLMSVEGKILRGERHEDLRITLEGVASVNLGNGDVFRGVPFEVVLVAGGPGAGRITLTVHGAFDGVPGDRLPGNGDYDLPTETVASGEIVISSA